MIENMLNMQAEKSSTGQMFWIKKNKKTSNTGENILEIDFVIN